jgi:hypothetical protein
MKKSTGHVENEEHDDGLGFDYVTHENYHQPEYKEVHWDDEVQYGEHIISFHSQSKSRMPDDEYHPSPSPQATACVPSLEVSAPMLTGPTEEDIAGEFRLHTEALVTRSTYLI